MTCKRRLFGVTNKFQIELSGESSMAFVRGVGDTMFGKLEGADTLGLMAAAADEALADGGLSREDIDGVLCGYSYQLPHIMIASLFSEYYGIKPTYCHGV